MNTFSYTTVQERVKINCCSNHASESYSVTKPTLKRWGGGNQTGWIWQPHPRSKGSAYWKDEEKEEFGDFNYEFFYHHALYVGYNVTNTLYTTLKAGKGVRGLAPRQINFVQRWEMALRKSSELHTGMSQEPFGWGAVMLNLSEFIWLVSCSIVTDHYSFQYLNAMLFRYLHAIGGRRASMAIETFDGYL